MNEKNEVVNHDIILRSRKRLEMSGINEVSSFDEKEIVAQISGAGISIDGENLKIEKFDAENGLLVINGKINGIFYYNKDQKKKKGFMGIFR